MTFPKKNILIFTLVVIMVITLSACDKISFLGNDEKSSSEEDIILSEETSSDGENEVTSSGEANIDTDKDALIQETMGSATFSYNEEYEVFENEGIKYIYFNEKDFFIAESSGKVYDEENMTEENAKQVFLAIEESYNQAGGDWGNGKQEGKVTETTVAGYNGWSVNFSMDYQGTKKYASKVILTYVDGEILIFSVLSQSENMKESEDIFEKIISTITIK